MANRLAGEKSPYLLQHADNPVDWYPWGDDAFDLARSLDRPVFLSIGYSTCHWCHVMERESFVDEEVAAVLNSSYVSVKVDREERPDVDAVYMKAAQAMLEGQGGWPLTIVMTPEGKPFFAGTYLPRESGGSAGMLEVLPMLAAEWKKDRHQVVARAQALTGQIRQMRDDGPGGFPSDKVLENAFRGFRTLYDPRDGGFNVPKFPTPHFYMFLLRWWKRSGDDRALSMVTNSLVRMRRGGIFDQIGYGFHRYSTDGAWFLPHFEKMLYDQAMLVLLAVEAFQATGDGHHARIAAEVLEYVKRDLLGAEGGFYSAEDADSEGEEGLFYTWTWDELDSVLGDDAGPFRKAFNLRRPGNFREENSGRRTGRNIPYLKRGRTRLAKDLKLQPDELADFFSRTRSLLMAARADRVRPHLDDKVLTDWNGLMIAACARAGMVLNEPMYVSMAENAVRFVFKNMSAGDRLFHRFREEAGIEGMLDDYAFFVWGLLELYEATFEVRYLTDALRLMKDNLQRFRDGWTGGFWMVANDGEELVARGKESMDVAIPSGNSVMMHNLIRLARITGDPQLEETALGIPQAFSELIRKNPTTFAWMLSGVDFVLGPSHEIVLVTADEEPPHEFLEVLRTNFWPNRVVLWKHPGNEDELAEIAPFTQEMTIVDGKPTAYVCRNQACDLPTTDPGSLIPP